MSESIKGYEDIHSEEPYLNASFVQDVAYIDMLYVPPNLRNKGVGSKLVQEWVSTLGIQIKRVKLMACTLGGKDGIHFWESLGFTKAFSGGSLYSEIENTMVLGVNGYSQPVPEFIQEHDDFRHWSDYSEDLPHFNAHPQTLISQ
jgi:ribosomal protein S18 acetylase RimI-like enzyme